MGALEVRDYLLDDDKLRGKRLLHIEGGWFVASGLEGLGVSACDRRGAGFNRGRKRTPFVEPQIGVFVDEQQIERYFHDY